MNTNPNNFNPEEKKTEIKIKVSMLKHNVIELRRELEK